jgi:Arc/MetJ-type ribon-helix-helix transcriptional regulator
MKTFMLRIRVEPEFKQQLQKAVAEGKAETMSELIRKAVLIFLEAQNG